MSKHRPSWSDTRLACRFGGQARRLSLHLEFMNFHNL